MRAHTCTYTADVCGQQPVLSKRMRGRMVEVCCTDCAYSAAYGGGCAVLSARIVRRMEESVRY
eukprot:552058-Rhodomonas_salina.1